MAQLIKKPQIQWTKDKITMLRQEYPLGDKRALATKLGIKYTTLKDAARRFQIKSLKDVNSHKLKPLYEDSLFAYYWMGFILADGYIRTKTMELKVTLSEKDEKHLEKLASFLGQKMKKYRIKDKQKIVRNYCVLTCGDMVYGKKITEKFNLNPSLPKTYNPPTTLNFPNEKFFLAFLIGMIDGDGAFSKNKDGECQFIRIELHKSWERILNLIKIKLQENGFLNVKTGINTRGYAFFKLYKYQNLKFLKQFVVKHQLPFLERKWESINENRVPKKRTKDNELNQELLHV